MAFGLGFALESMDMASSASLPPSLAPSAPNQVLPRANISNSQVTTQSGVAKVGAEKRALTRRIKRTGSDKASVVQRLGGILAEGSPVIIARITQPSQLIIVMI